MRVDGLNNISGYGPLGADRAGKDGQRKGQQQAQDQPKKQAEDEVQLHGPAGEAKPAVADGGLKPDKPVGDGKPRPLDLSA